MGRLIDADALLDDVRKNSESYFADDFAKEWVDRQPTIEPQQQWIPCKERLPKTTKWRTNFVVTVECDGWNPKRQTMVAEWENTTVRGKPVSRWIWNNRLFPADWKIIAWGPLPAPFREGET